jgi:hypothetical protein
MHLTHPHNQPSADTFSNKRNKCSSTSQKTLLKEHGVHPHRLAAWLQRGVGYEHRRRRQRTDESVKAAQQALKNEIKNEEAASVARRRELSALTRTRQQLLQRIDQGRA